jgi:transposase
MDLGKIKRIGRGRPRLRAAYLAADKAYDSDKIRNGLRERGVTPVIPSRRTRKRVITIDRERYRSRNVIERCFNRLKHWRRVATRYEKHAVNYTAMLLIVGTMHFLKLVI